MAAREIGSRRQTQSIEMNLGTLSCTTYIRGVRTIPHSECQEWVVEDPKRGGQGGFQEEGEATIAGRRKTCSPSLLLPDQ